MKVDLSVIDFLDRAETVFPDRVVFVDEPDQIAESWGEVTGAEFARRARNQAAHLDALGIGVGERVAIISQNSARPGLWILRGVGLGDAPTCRSTSASARPRSPTSSTTAGPRCCCTTRNWPTPLPTLTSPTR